ncbi:hypothetical protein BDZ97DRAFT_1076172 [Flammula alnicola]|nr:hypothetical protein BDZ97DRAFT_1076172 [Flammula alnicola]
MQDWNSIPSSLQMGLRKMIQTPTLRYLFLSEHINVPVSIILPTARLDTLSLNGSSAFTYAQSIQELISDADSIQLKSFSFQGSGYSSVAPLFHFTRSNGLPILDLSYLEMFSATLCSPQDEAPIALLLEGMTQLKTNISTEPSEYIHLPNILNRVHPRSLETLGTLWFQIWFHGGFDATIHSLPTAILKGMSGMPSLVYLGISIRLILPVNQSSLRDDFTKLDELLATPQYATLRTVYICLSFFGARVYDREEWAATPRILMPRLSGNSSVKFIFLPQPSPNFSS